MPATKEMIPNVSSLSALGIVGFVVGYLLTQTIPAMNEQAEANREACIEAQERALDVFREEIAEERKYHTEQADEISETIQQNTSAILELARQHD